MSIKQGVDTYIVYRIIKALATPFNETEAYKLGLVDENGKKLKNASTSEEKNAITYFDRLIFNLKRIMAKVGLSSKTATFGAALLLVRENIENKSENEIITSLVENEAMFKKDDRSPYRIIEEEIANSTGPAVAGTGDTGIHWVDKKRRGLQIGPDGNRKVMGRQINGAAYLKRIARDANRRKVAKDV